ncbi:unnamed protein product [Discula destructiva]
MKVLEEVKKLEMGESQNQRDRHVEELWKKLDPQGVGELDVRGLQKGLRRIDHPLKNADDMMQEIVKMVDVNQDGKIQYEEFRVFVEAAERQLLLLFKSIDRNHDGQVGREELETAFRKACLTVPKRRVAGFFDEIDMNHDGFISFEEWRDFLLFMPTTNQGSPLAAALSYYSNMVTVNAEGDSSVSDDKLEGLGYFAAGALSGGISRTATAPIDRLKVYLLVDNKSKTNILAAAKAGYGLTAVRQAGTPVAEAVRDLYRTGGVRTFFAGNGLNVIKIMPETAIKFGTYEFMKRTLANLEGHGDPDKMNPYSKFAAGGIAGMTAQFCVYPLDTLKFRLQCETVKGGLTGNPLLVQTARNMVKDGVFRTAYRGITMGLIGMFPYSAIDMGTFEFLKKNYARYKARHLGIHEEDALPGNFATGIIGATSGAFGATVVYPLNVLRTRLQTQGTKMHPPTYTGIMDVFMKTYKNEGVRGMYKGLGMNLLKVAPALSITWVTYENSKRIMGLH